MRVYYSNLNLNQYWFRYISDDIIDGCNSVQKRTSRRIRAEKWNMTWTRALSLKQVYASFAQWRHHSGRLRSRERKRPRRATHAGYEERGRRETRREAGTVIAKPNRLAVSRRLTAVATRIRVVLLPSWWWSRIYPGHRLFANERAKKCIM